MSGFSPGHLGHQGSLARRFGILWFPPQESGFQVAPWVPCCATGKPEEFGRFLWLVPGRGPLNHQTASRCRPVGWLMAPTQLWDGRPSCHKDQPGLEGWDFGSSDIRLNFGSPGRGGGWRRSSCAGARRACVIARHRNSRPRHSGEPPGQGHRDVLRRQRPQRCKSCLDPDTDPDLYPLWET